MEAATSNKGATQGKPRLEVTITEVSEEYERTRDVIPGEKSPPQLSTVDVDDGKLVDLPGRSLSHTIPNKDSPRKLTMAAAKAQG